MCDGAADCADGSDEWDCSYALPRKVITAAGGSLVCGLLLVIALGCTCKLYAIRTQEYRSVGRSWPGRRWALKGGSRAVWPQEA